MDRDFFIKVTFAAHKVAGILPAGDLRDRMVRSSNSLLAELILSSGMDAEEKRVLAVKALRELGVLLACFYEAKEKKLVAGANFLVLEKAYGKIRGILEEMARAQEDAEPLPMVKPESVPTVSFTKEAAPGELSSRQQKILDLIKGKGRAQVWELQKLLSEVTKRTLRRDLDDLLRRNLIERAGEWNAIFYRIRPVENMLTEIGQG